MIAAAGVCPLPFPQVRGLLLSEQDILEAEPRRGQESLRRGVRGRGVRGRGVRGRGIRGRGVRSGGGHRVVGSLAWEWVGYRFRRGPSPGGETNERSETLGAVGLGRKRCEVDLVSSTPGGFDESRVSEK